MKTAVIYTRYSDGKQDDGYSIQAQRDACLEYAERNGFDVIQVFEDRATTGTNDNRPHFRAMMDLATSAKRSPFDILLIHNTNRFARSRMDSVKNKFILRQHGVRIISVTQAFMDTGGPEDVILEGIFESLDEYYSKNLAKETMKGMRKHIEAGYWKGGNPPYGYRLQKESGTRPRSRLVIDEAEAIVVHEIFKLYSSGDGYRAIANKLNARNLKTRAGQPWSKGTIDKMLRAIVYTGATMFGDSHFENTHPAIIPQSEFSVAEKTSIKRARGPLIRNNEYLLSGILKCQCGAAMGAKSAKSGQYAYYECGNLHRYGKCPEGIKRISTTRLESIALDLLKKELLTRARIRALVVDLLNETKAKNRLKIETSKATTARIAENERKLKKLIGILEDSETFEAADLAPRIRELRTEIEADKLKLSQIKVRPESSPRDEARSIQTFIETIAEFVASPEFLRDKAAVHEVIDSIQISGDSVIINWVMPARAATTLRLQHKQISANEVRICDTTGYHSSIFELFDSFKSKIFTVKFPVSRLWVA